MGFRGRNRIVSQGASVHTAHVYLLRGDGKAGRTGTRVADRVWMQARPPNRNRGHAALSAAALGSALPWIRQDWPSGVGRRAGRRCPPPGASRHVRHRVPAGRARRTSRRLLCHPCRPQNYSLLDVRPPPTVVTLGHAVYWPELEDACAAGCLDGKDCRSFFCCYEECRAGAWRRGRAHVHVLELDAYARVLFPTSFLLFNLVYWVGYLYL